jgi:hypothetical protein
MKSCDAGEENDQNNNEKQPSKGKYLAAHVYRDKRTE